MPNIKLLIKNIQKNGIPLMFIKDPVRSVPSVSLTLLLISFSMCLFALVNKFAKIVDGVDTDSSLDLLIICASLYFGRSVTHFYKKK